MSKTAAKQRVSAKRGFANGRGNLLHPRRKRPVNGRGNLFLTIVHFTFECICAKVNDGFYLLPVMISFIILLDCCRRKEKKEE